LLNLPTIFARFSTFYATLKSGEDNLHSGLDSTLQLHHALFETCLGEALPHLAETVQDLLRVGAMRALDPKLVERTYSTFSLIIRTMAPFLLKPTPAAQQSLLTTWSTVKPYIRPKSNKKYVRKCVADAWAGVIRKARGESLTRLMSILLNEEEQGMEAIWAVSLRGTTHNLHSRALPIIIILLDRLVAEPTPARLDTLNYVFTALCHHCSATALTPVAESVLDRLSVAESLQVVSEEAVLSVSATMLLVRKGKRYPESLLKPTMVKLQSILTEGHAKEQTYRGWRRAWVMCVVGTLQSGKLAQWLSPGVKLIETLWSKLVSLERVAATDGRIHKKHLHLPIR
jgi:U3 small nucleolar RNA-associated protein 20